MLRTTHFLHKSAFGETKQMEYNKTAGAVAGRWPPSSLRRRTITKGMGNHRKISI